ncbi:MAG: hypothetical protein OEL79_05885 [Chromatiales bacterium]|nr:hypothetical protein [Chromatiales bacterium]
MTNQKDTEKSERRTKANVTPISGGSSQSENADHHMDRLATAFESSAHRWELMVYPSLFAFIILASYGFFLIYSLTTDIATMSRNISQMTVVIDKMSSEMNNLTPMRKSMDHMSTDIRAMTINADGMRRDIGYMGREIGSMNHNVGRMSNAMPW